MGCACVAAHGGARAAVDPFLLLQPWATLSLTEKDRLDALVDCWEPAAIRALQLKFTTAKGGAPTFTHRCFDELFRCAPIPEVRAAAGGGERWGVPADAFCVSMARGVDGFLYLPQALAPAAFHLFALSDPTCIELGDLIRVLSLALHGSPVEQAAVLRRWIKGSKPALPKAVRPPPLLLLSVHECGVDARTVVPRTAASPSGYPFDSCSSLPLCVIPPPRPFIHAVVSILCMCMHECLRARLSLPSHQDVESILALIFSLHACTSVADDASAWMSSVFTQLCDASPPPRTLPRSSFRL